MGQYGGYGDESRITGCMGKMGDVGGYGVYGGYMRIMGCTEDIGQIEDMGHVGSLEGYRAE